MKIIVSEMWLPMKLSDVIYKVVRHIWLSWRNFGTELYTLIDKLQPKIYSYNCSIYPYKAFKISNEFQGWYNFLE